jgi:hypothetical protein
MRGRYTHLPLFAVSPRLSRMLGRCTHLTLFAFIYSIPRLSSMRGRGTHLPLFAVSVAYRICAVGVHICLYIVVSLAYRICAAGVHICLYLHYTSPIAYALQMYRYIFAFFCIIHTSLLDYARQVYIFAFFAVSEPSAA